MSAASVGARRALGAALAAAAACLFLWAPAAHATSTLVVDDDKAQCPNAGYTDLDAAVNNAQSHDKIKICAGDYPVDTATAPSTTRCPEDSAANPNGLRLNKSLDITGAGAGLVTIHPTRDLGDGQIRDNKGDVITVCASQPGSTSFQDVTVNIAGVTVTDGGFKVDSAINFYNSGGSVSSSTIGAMTGTGLGWGVAATNGYSVSPAGAFSRTVSLTGDKIFGYGAGGVLADGAKAATPTTASGVATTVNVSASTITGTADVARASQSGVQINAGARSLIQSSAISNNQASDPRNGVGVLLTNADTLGNSAIPPAVPTTSQFFTRIGSNNFSGDGYGIFNADATNTGVRLGAPVQITTGGTGATGNYFGSAAGPLVGSPSAAGQEGISGPDSTPAPSFTPSTGTYFATTPRTVAATPAGITDASPTVSWGSPGAGDSFFTEEDNDVLVLAGDDFGVTKVDVTIDGVPQPSLTLSPYELTYTPSAAQAGTTVHISATATDSAGHTSTSDLDVPVIERPVTPPPPPPPPPGSGSAGAGATTPKTTCKKHKKKHHKKKKKKKKKCKK